MAQAEYPMTPEGAANWVAMVEQTMADFSLESAQIYWVNSTYITHDTDAMAARVGAQGTEMSVQYALEAAKYAQVDGLDPG